MIYNFKTDLLKFLRLLGKEKEKRFSLMFLVLHDIHWLYCPPPCYTYWFPLTLDDSTISRNTETRNSFFFPICRGICRGLPVLRQKNCKSVFSRCYVFE